jgi:two-component system, NarL family, sensor kinase
MKKKNPASETNIGPMKEAEETLRAICNGAVDAFVVEEPEGHRVYTLEGADLPYSVLVERMRDGAAILDARGDMIYCNPSLADLIGVPRETVVGLPLQNFLPATDHSSLQKLLHETQNRPTEGEMSVRRGDGALISANFSFRLLSRDKSVTGVLITDLTVQNQQRELTSRLQKMQDDERRRIARELHDSVGQLLAAITMNISKVKHEAHKLSPDTARLVDDNAAMVNEISCEIRTISHLLHPPLLDEVGLPSALRWYIDGFAQRSKIEATLEMSETLMRLPQDVEIAIFRAVQECLTNIHRHSGSPSCAVKLIQEGGQLRVEIKDTGRGIPQAKQLTMTSSEGVGLRGMRERIRQLGGTLEIDSSKNGTVVIATLPMPDASSSYASKDVA